MKTFSPRLNAKMNTIHRRPLKIHAPTDSSGKALRMAQYFGENVFNVLTAPEIPPKYREQLLNFVHSGQKELSRDLAEVVASAVVTWATARGVTHFCHWFQPLTEATAEKHDSFIDFENGLPVERLSASQLIKGEPDASSFPNGGARSTFEARGYTSWDFTSPMFIMEGVNGKTLYIPTAFISYLGDALDKKIPLLRSLERLNERATQFLNLIGREVERVDVTVGAEQEYFLVDKNFYYLRPDLVMTGRTLFGPLSTKHQQMEDHYFGTIKPRVLAFMQELEIELYKLGIPAKTRHNEVAPGQFELASIYKEANVASDQNQVVMAILEKVAEKHDFVALLHEKPFYGINGSGKHLNWSMADDRGRNLLSPGGDNAEENLFFYTMVSIILEAVYRHSDALRMSISAHSNDLRLGGHEAPPSIISVYLGEALSEFLDKVRSGGRAEFQLASKRSMQMGTEKIAAFMADNTDRNRTSPFAFTGNKFEFRAVGSSASISLPTTVLNAAVSEVFAESSSFVSEKLKQGKSREEALYLLIEKWSKSAFPIIFNGNGYSAEWVEEAKRRGLPNFRNTYEALSVLADPKRYSFLTEQQIFSSNELQMRHNVMLERYNKYLEIEVRTLRNIVEQSILPSAMEYKGQLVASATGLQGLKLQFTYEQEILQQVNSMMDRLYAENVKLGLLLDEALQSAHKAQDEIVGQKLLAQTFAEKIVPLSRAVANICNEMERIVPDHLWELPKYFDMLFIK